MWFSFIGIWAENQWSNIIQIKNDVLSILLEFVLFPKVPTSNNFYSQIIMKDKIDNKYEKKL